MAVEQAVVDIDEQIREMLIKKLKDKAKELGRVPTQADFGYRINVFYRVFGSWNNALQAAGFPVRELNRLKYRYLQGQSYRPTKEDCIEALKRLSEELGGYRPTCHDVESEVGVKAGCPKWKVIVRLFGSFDAAIEEAGLKDLPTKRASEGRGGKVLRILDNQGDGSFYLSAEVLDRRTREHLKKQGIPIIPTPKSRAMLTVLDWLRGIEQEGILPARDEIRSAMGERAFEFLTDYCKGMTLRDIGEKHGISYETVRVVMTKGAEAAVKKLTKKT